MNDNDCRRCQSLRGKGPHGQEAQGFGVQASRATLDQVIESTRNQLLLSNNEEDAVAYYTRSNQDVQVIPRWSVPGPVAHESSK